MRKRFWTKSVRTVLVIAVILAILVTLGTALRQGAQMGEGVFSTVLTPLRSLVSAFDRGAERLYGYLFRYDSLAAEKEALESRLASQEDALRTAENYRRENQRLRELLGLAEEHEDYKFISAYVIAWEADTWENTLTVEKGTSAGLAEGMCAVTGDGHLIGIISAVGPNWARVSTVYDPSTRISASVVSSGYTGVVQGAAEKDGTAGLQLRYLSTGAALKNGDSVVTSGSTMYPKGLIIGTVSQAGLDETGASLYAGLTAGFRPEKLEQIFFISDYRED